jgi:hypothetical protein
LLGASATAADEPRLRLLFPLELFRDLLAIDVLLRERKLTRGQNICG